MKGFPEALGAQIRAWRETRGLSIREACLRYAAAMRLEKAIPASRWVAIESGNRQLTVPELIGVSMALDTAVSRLIGDDDAALDGTPQGINGGMSMGEIAGALKRQWVRHVDPDVVQSLAAGHNLPALVTQIATMIEWPDDDGRAAVEAAALHLYGVDVLTEREARTLDVVAGRKRAGEKVTEDQVQRIRGHATRAMADEIFEAIKNGEV